ncbi:MAG: DUF2892 domain-containing protein [Chitinophagaceae bacterium]|nr:MAG: DUF2892 domain-containing protein [Chitinophagaceae bacterium]
MKLLDKYLESPDEINVTDSDRLISALGGVAVIGLALADSKSSGISKWLKIAGGAVLIYRAATGYCPVQKALDKA